MVPVLKDSKQKIDVTEPNLLREILSTFLASSNKLKK